MARMKVHKNKNYTVMSNYHFRNSSLSFKAMGLLSFMLSVPDDWDFSVEGLAKCARDGRDSISAGLKELEEAGHLVRRQVRGERGRIIDTEYDLYEEPIIDASSTMSRVEYATAQMEEDGPVPDFPETEKSESTENEEIDESIENTDFSPVTENPEVVEMMRILPVTEKPLTVKPSADNPLTENPQQINTNIINTKILSTKEINTDDESSSKKNSSPDTEKNDAKLKERIRYQEAVRYSSENIAAGVLVELKNNPDVLKIITPNLFRTICENIALYSKQMVNKKAYIKTCIKNIIEASQINQDTFNGSCERHKKKDYIQITG